MKRKITSLLSSAVILSSLVAPIFISNNTFASPQCPDSAADILKIAREATVSDIVVSLCGDINEKLYIDTYRAFIGGGGTYKYREITIKLNGHNINKGIEIEKDAFVTITGNGNVSGTISANPNSRLTISGGTYSFDPSTPWVRDSNFAAYKVGNVWKVESKITDITVDPSFLIRQNNTSKINASVLPTTSTSGVKCNTGTDTNVATVTEDCQVAAKKAGTTTVSITPTYKDNQGNDLAISKPVTVKVLPKIYTVDFGEIPSVRLGGGAKTLTPKAINEDGSDFIYPVTFTYTSNNPAVATVNSQGEVTGVSAGTAEIVVELSYRDEIGPVTESRTITVPVYDIQPGDSSDNNDKIAADTLINAVDKPSLDESIFENKDTSGLKTAMSSGALITTNVNVQKTQPTDPNVIAAIQGVLPKNISGIAYYDVTVDIMTGGTVIGRLVQLDNPLTVAIADAKQPAAGYERKYYVVAYHNGVAQMLVEGQDFKIENGKIYLISDKFSIFAVAYEDTLIPIQKSSSVKSPDTGHFTATKSKANNNNTTAANSFIGLGTLLVMFTIIGISGLAKLTRKQ